MEKPHNIWLKGFAPLLKCFLDVNIEVHRKSAMETLDLCAWQHSMEKPAKRHFTSTIFFALRANLVCIDVEDIILSLNQSCQIQTVAQKHCFFSPFGFNSKASTGVNKSTKEKKIEF